jgi:hypothetical protein
MSQKALVITALVAVLAATLVAPAAAAPLNGDEVVPVRTEGRLEPGVYIPGPRVPIQPLGDCEGGSGGGCPVSG